MTIISKFWHFISWIDLFSKKKKKSQKSWVSFIFSVTIGTIKLLYKSLSWIFFPSLSESGSNLMLHEYFFSHTIWKMAFHKIKITWWWNNLNHELFYSFYSSVCARRVKIFYDLYNDVCLFFILSPMFLSQSPFLLGGQGPILSFVLNSSPCLK